VRVQLTTLIYISTVLLCAVSKRLSPFNAKKSVQTRISSQHNGWRLFAIDCDGRSLLTTDVVWRQFEQQTVLILERILLETRMSPCGGSECSNRISCVNLYIVLRVTMGLSCFVFEISSHDGQLTVDGLTDVGKYRISGPEGGPALTLYGHIKTAEQRTIIQQYGDWYTGRWWVGCYIWHSPVSFSMYQI